MARNATRLRFCFFPQTIVCLFLLFTTHPASALDELFETYNAAQALAMGNAFSADASGYSALFYNPAGLAKNPAKTWEVTPLALDGTSGTPLFGSFLANRDLGMRALLANTQTHPGSYHFLKGTVVPSVARRGFALALIASSDFAALSDGTQADVRAGTDLGFAVGAATNFASNMIKIGITAKALLRNQLKGVYGHAGLGTDAEILALMKEGVGFGADLGTSLTLPLTWLPTLAVVWKDMGNTRFLPMTFLNPSNTGAPDFIPQTFNLAFSAHPAIGRKERLTFSAEFRHLERNDLSYQQRLHFGLQYVARKSLFLWLGMNQFFPTAGVALRVSGGDFEFGTYAQDVGSGGTLLADRRFFFRYTIGF
jgi:hypothetical protein